MLMLHTACIPYENQRGMRVTAVQKVSLCGGEKENSTSASRRTLYVCVFGPQQHMMIREEHNKKIVYGLTGIMCTGRREERIEEKRRGFRKYKKGNKKIGIKKKGQKNGRERKAREAIKGRGTELEAMGRKWQRN